MWGQWYTWGTCSVTCGGGTQGRNRSITQQALHGGDECIGEENDTQTCNSFSCPGIGIYVKEHCHIIIKILLYLSTMCMESVEHMGNLFCKLWWGNTREEQVNSSAGYVWW